MGYPQTATPIQTNNACAAGIANDTIRQRRSKAVDMPFYWIRLVGGTMYLGGMLLGCWNLFQTARGAPSASSHARAPTALAP